MTRFALLLALLVPVLAGAQTSIDVKAAVARAESAAIRAEVAAIKAQQKSTVATEAAERAEAVVRIMEVPPKLEVTPEEPVITEYTAPLTFVPRRASMGGGGGTDACGVDPGAVTTDGFGMYEITNIESGTKIKPFKVGGTCNAISALDASWILQYVVGKREFDSFQLLACDTTGNGTCSSLDAAKILQYMVGKIDRLPAADLCCSDWLFWPVISALPVGVDLVTVAPNFAGGVCTMGSAEYTWEEPPPDGRIIGQNYKGIVIGDVTGNWQPCEE